MYEAGLLAGNLLVRRAQGRDQTGDGLPLAAAAEFDHAARTEDGPSGMIIAYARRMERDGSVLAATLLPGFPHADTPWTGLVGRGS